MRIGINVSWLSGFGGGIGRYIYNLVRGLQTVDPEGDYVLYAQTSLPEQALPPGLQMRRLIVSERRWGVRLPMDTSLILARAGIQVVHEQVMAPFIFPARLVITLHDTLHEHYPSFYPPSALRRMRLLVPLTLRRASVIVTDSNFSRKDIERVYGVSPEKIMVAHLAADPMFIPISDHARLEKVRDRYATGPHFVLFAGSLKPTKNLKRVVEAYVRLRRADATRHRLVVVGAEAWALDDIFTLARSSGYIDDIIFTGFVPDADLVALYSAADLFVHPSLFEGFGLPALEAMACGTPVVTSNTSAIPEVVGAAALTVDPLDVEALATAMSNVLNDDQEQARLSRLGLERAATFTWENTAKMMQGAYQRAARDH